MDVMGTPPLFMSWYLSPPFIRLSKVLKIPFISLLLMVAYLSPSFAYCVGWSLVNVSKASIFLYAVCLVA